MGNARGDVPLIVGGETFTLRFTLNALAELEETMGVESLPEIGERIAAGRARDIVLFIGALMRGGGHDLDQEQVKKLPLPIEESIDAAFEAFEKGVPQRKGSEGEEKNRTAPRGKRTTRKRRPGGATGK